MDKLKSESLITEKVEKDAKRVRQRANKTHSIKQNIGFAKLLDNTSGCS